MRVFYAIEFEEDIKEYIYEKVLALKGKSIKGNFGRKENIHLTLKFIGEVEIEKVKGLSNVLDNIATGKKIFSLVMNQVGQFDRGQNAIIWIGIEESESLQNLHASLDNELSKLGYEKERKKFVPHITLGRQVVLRSAEIFKDIKISGTIQVKKLSLMESKRVDGVLKYIPVHTVQLGDRV